MPVPEEDVASYIAEKALILDKNASSVNWYSELTGDGFWELKLGPRRKLGGIYRDTMQGATDKGNLDLITFYRNHIPVLATAYLELKKKYDELAKVSER